MPMPAWARPRPARWRLPRASPAIREPAPQCLKCHATAYHQPAAGVQETYAVPRRRRLRSVPRRRQRTRRRGGKTERPGALAVRSPKTTEQTCAACHANAHGKPFDYEAALAAIAHPKVPPEVKAEPRYKTPLNLALRPDGRELYVTCEAADSVIVVDTATRQQGGRDPRRRPADGRGLQPRRPPGLRQQPAGRLACRSSTSAHAQVVATIPVGDEPHGVLTDRGGQAPVRAQHRVRQHLGDRHGHAKKSSGCRPAAARGRWPCRPTARGSIVTNMLLAFREPSARRRCPR